MRWYLLILLPHFKKIIGTMVSKKFFSMDQLMWKDQNQIVVWSGFFERESFERATKIFLHQDDSPAATKKICSVFSNSVSFNKDESGYRDCH